MSNIPKLRFPEFSEEWEEKKFSEIVYLENERDVCKKSDYITTENLNKDYAGVTFNTNSNEIVPGIKYLKDDILFGNIRPYLKKVWQADRNGCVNSDVLVFKIIKDNSKFINNIICSDLFLSHVMNGAKGTKMPRGDKNQMMDFIAKIPSLAEQQKIADFLANVDSIITAETKILNTLQKKKKALMQKLFTRQLRFKSDDGTNFPEWEEKKLGDVCEISAGGDIDKENSQKIYSEQYPYAVYSNSLENKGLYGYANYFKIDGNTITVTGRGDVGHAIARHEKYVPIVRLLVCKPINNENVDFLENAINNTKIFIESTGVPQLTAPQLSNIFIKLPCIEEQQKIADCLSSLDSLIQTQQKVVTAWQQRKKALLQQMFI